MNDTQIKRLLRLLLALLGAGLGLAITLAAVLLIRFSNAAIVLPLGGLAAAYVITALVFAGAAWWLSDRAADGIIDGFTHLVRSMDEMSVGQLISCLGGTIIGFVFAALLSQILHFMGDSMFTTVCSCILFLLLGFTGYTLGHHRSRDVEQLLSPPTPRRMRFHARGKLKHVLRPKAAAPVRVLDASVLIDGRIAELSKLDFPDGEMTVPAFIVEELGRMADAADAQKRAKGRRALDMLAKLPNIRTDESADDANETSDARLLHLCTRLGATLITCDSSLCKIARYAGVKYLNLNEIASALRPSVAAGDELTVTLMKEGREPTQGVGYLPDGTMIVVEGGRRHIGETLPVTVTTALQTTAGRMIFAKVREA